MKIFLVLLCFFLFCYDKSQGCGSCFPGTSSSQCPYRKPTDPIICGSDGKKYTPCTYNCVRGCNPSLSVAGSGSNCVTTYGTSCPPIAVTTLPPSTTGSSTTDRSTPSILTSVTLRPTISITSTTTVKSPADQVTTPTTTASTQKPPCKQWNSPQCQFSSCNVPGMEIQCERCNPDTAATGGCLEVGICWDEGQGDGICDVSFNTSACDLNPESEQCITCPSNSPAKGNCV